VEKIDDVKSFRWLLGTFFLDTLYSLEIDVLMSEIFASRNVHELLHLFSRIH